MRLRATRALPLLVVTACAPSAPSPPVAALPPVAPVAAAAPPPPPPLVHVQVLAINDFHGNLLPPHGHDGSVVGPGGVSIPAGGAAYLAAHIQRLRAKNPNTVVVSAGDLTGASPLVSSLFDDEPTVLVMNQIGLQFEGVGNHDFDRGLAELTRLQTGGPPKTTAKGGVGSPPFPGARFEYLAANVFGPDGKPVFPAYAIRELAGVKVAFVGMTLKGTPAVTTHEAVTGLTFTDEAETANKLLPELRAQGVATTVIVLHQGGFQDAKGTYDSCTGLTGDILPIVQALDPAFRVVVTAHMHQAYNCDLDGRRVTSAASFGRVVTDIDLAIDPTRGELVDVRAENLPVTHDIPPDPDVERLVADYVAKAAPVTERVVGYQRGALTADPHAAHSPSCETPLGDLIADGQLAATRGAGAVIAFMNPGGVRTDLVPEGGADVAPVRYGAAFEVQPFGNHLVTVSLSGADLRALLERQFRSDRPRVLAVSTGFTYRYSYDKTTKTATVDPLSIRLRGQPIDRKRKYRVTANAFLANGGDGMTMLRDAPERTTGGLDVDAMVDHLARTTSPSHPLLLPAKLDRVVGNACE